MATLRDPDRQRLSTGTPFLMRVLHFYRTYLPETVGGVEQVIHQICLGSARNGVDVDVLTLCDTPTPSMIQLEGHRVFRAKSDIRIASTDFSMSVFKPFRELAQQADVLHYHFPWPFMDVVHFAAGIKKPSVVTYHSDIIRQRLLLTLYRPLMQRFLGSVTQIVATSPNYFETSDVLKQFRDKVNVIPIGLDRDSYPVPDEALKKRWREEVGEKFFLFVGMMRYYKGLHILLEAASTLPYPIIIVGAGPMEQSLKQHAAELGLSNVRFLGRISELDKTALLELCSAIVFPSHLRSEAFGVSLLEGAMYGKPLISSEIGTGTSYININDETGYVIPPSDPAALASAMRRLWENPEHARQLGEQARARYERLFTADKMCKGYADLYHVAQQRFRP